MKHYAFIKDGEVISQAYMSEEEAKRLSISWDKVIELESGAADAIGWRYKAKTQSLDAPEVTDNSQESAKPYTLKVLQASAPSNAKAILTETNAQINEGDRLVLKLQLCGPGKSAPLKTFNAALDLNWTNTSGRERLIPVKFEAGVAAFKTTFKDSGRWLLSPAEIQTAFSTVLKDSRVVFEGFTSNVRAVEDWI